MDKARLQKLAGIKITESSDKFGDEKTNVWFIVDSDSTKALYASLTKPTAETEINLLKRCRHKGGKNVTTVLKKYDRNIELVQELLHNGGEFFLESKSPIKEYIEKYDPHKKRHNIQVMKYEAHDDFEHNQMPGDMVSSVEMEPIMAYMLFYIFGQPHDSQPPLETNDLRSSKWHFWVSLFDGKKIPIIIAAKTGYGDKGQVDWSVWFQGNNKGDKENAKIVNIVEEIIDRQLQPIKY